MILILVLFGNIATASAHAVLLRTDPGDASTLTESPRQAHLWFNDTIELDFTSINLVDGDGRQVAVTGFRIDAQRTKEAIEEFNTRKAMVLEIDLPELPPQAYRLDWQSRSADDLHKISGTVIFGVNHSLKQFDRKEADTSPQPTEVVSRWLSLAGISGVIGGLALLFFIFPPARPLNAQTSQAENQARQRMLKVAGWSSLLALGAGVGLLVSQSFSGENNLTGWWTIIFRTAYGWRWIVSEVVLGLLAIVLLGKFQTKTKRFFYPTIGLLALSLLLAQSLNGHSPLSGSSPLSMAIDALHLLAASVWMGGLLALVVAIGPLLRKSGPENILAREGLGRFGIVAAISLAAVITTGLYKSGEQVASLDALLVTQYGQTLILKVYLVLFVAVIGLFNAAALHPRVARSLGWFLRKPPNWKPLSSRTLRRTILVEAMAGVGVIFLAALLGTSQPAVGPEFEPASKVEATPSYSGKVDDLVINLTVKPNRPGQNFISIGAYNTRRPAPAPIQAVKIQLVAPGQAEAISLNAEVLGEGRYQIAGGNLNKAGNWQISLVVSRPGMADAQVAIPWSVNTGEEGIQKRAILVSNQPLAPILNLSAALLTLLTFAAIGGRLISRKISWNFTLLRGFTTSRTTQAERREQQ